MRVPGGAGRARAPYSAGGVPARGRGDEMIETMSDCPLDLEEALGRTGGDREFLRELLEMLAEDVPARIAAIRRALAQGDAETVRAEAHTLKGAAANLAARQMADLALDVENRGRTGALDDVEALAGRLEREGERIAAFARSLGP